MKITAKNLILDLLTAASGPVPVRVPMRVATLFGITENNVRVTLARLLARGLVERDERGQYRISERAAAVRDHVASWANVEDRMVPWDGGWIGVHTAALLKSNRAARARRLRAFELLGFGEMEPDLWLRPDNLEGGVEAVRTRLHELGLDPGALVFLARDLDGEGEARARRLWDVKALQTGYRKMRGRLLRSARRMSKVPIEKSIVESFVLGGECLRQIALDPLLPEPILPAEERRKFIQEMRRYDRIGREYWRQFVHEHAEEIFSPPVHVHAVAIMPP
jgi:phenylacetic acid degradation operon negative regulatory protein